MHINEHDLVRGSYSYQKGKLNKSARTGLISLLPKKDKDILKLKAWHPLTLLNLDYKILSKLLAERMKTVLPHIIHTDQTGFMQGRLITDNLKRTLEVIKHCNKNRIEGIILTIDFEKCFDKIEHNTILGALRYFKFPDSFVQWSKLFFTDFKVFTQNFGHKSNSINKTCGTNQGCCISPFYYLCCGEILSRKMRQNKNIVGIQVGEVTNLMSQFANDTALFLKYDKFVLENVIKVLTLIETHTGLTVNYDKTLIYRMLTVMPNCILVKTLTGPISLFHY